MPVPVISLTTDFGRREPFVGLLRAVVLARCPEAVVVDLTHDVTPFRVGEAGFWLERCYRYFPRGTVHLAVVDPGVGSSRQLLALRVDGHLFLGPDNGLLGVLAQAPGAEARRVGPAVIARMALAQVSATFHGRDLFAPLAAELAAGRLAFDQLGEVCHDFVPSPMPAPRETARAVIGEVILIDSFGNCFSNLSLSPEVISRIERVTFGSTALPLVHTYSDRPPGTPIALVNSFGVVEAACVEDRACDRLALSPGTSVKVALRKAPLAAGLKPSDGG